MIDYIAIVGGGPKGMYGLERLVAQLNARPLADPYGVEIHFFNRSPHFGCGEIYQPYQPDYLLMNYAAGNINMWIDEEPLAAVPNPRPFTEWAADQHNPVDTLAYPSRSDVGEYLQDGFAAILANLPANVRVKPIVGTVVDIKATGEGYQLGVTRCAAAVTVETIVYSHVLLATGHPRQRPHGEYQEFLERHPHNWFVPFVYPVKKHLHPLPEQQTVLVKGLGLTFVDTVLALTEGRGGRFVEGEQGLRYQPSGREPAAIYPFSRSGLPILPRPAYVGGEAAVPPRFFTDEALDKLLTKGEKIDFEAQLWPLLKQEMSYTYYRVLMAQFGETLADDGLMMTLAHQIEGFHKRYPAIKRFEPEQFLDPLDGQHALRPEAQHQFICDYLSKAIAAAEAGEAQNPEAAVTTVWRHAIAVFRRAYHFGGLTAASQQQFNEQFLSSLNRITFGPPIASMRKVLALAECGLLNFGLGRGGRVEADGKRGCFTLSNGYQQADAPILIDARIPKVSYADNASPLYRRLIARGLARPFTNCDEGGRYQPGCVEISAAGFLLNRAGAETNIALTGTPTEGVVFDNDSLSRHCNNFVSGWAAAVHRDLISRSKTYHDPIASSAPDPAYL